MQLIVEAQLVIRRSVNEVFNAFLDPAVTTRFWFTKSSGVLEEGKQVRWEWEMYNVGTTVQVQKIEANQTILIEWNDPPCPVQWTFTSMGDGATLVKICNWGFQGDDNAIAAQALDSKGGFTVVLAGAKAFLEHGIELNLVADQFPKGLPATS